MSKPSEKVLEELRLISQLYDFDIIECNKYPLLTKEEIKSISVALAKEEECCLITIGWSTDNPRICLNKNGKSD